MTPLMELRDVHLHAGPRVLTRGLHWRIEPGQRWCVIGRNAAGKSMLLRALAGLLHLRAGKAHLHGEVLWQGRDAAQWSPAQAAAWRALQPQVVHDAFGLPAQRLLDLSQGAQPVAQEAWIQARIQALIHALDLGAVMTRDVRELSGGERQRLALAQCAAQGAAVMLLDEPVAFQDPAHQAAVARWLCTMPAQALVATAHDVNWVARVATHVLALHEGGAWTAGPVREVLAPGTLRAVYGCAWRCVEGMWLSVGQEA
jgi:iron complex transport system ATP-binding protein